MGRFRASLALPWGATRAELCPIRLWHIGLFFAFVGLFAYLVTPIGVSFLATFLRGDTVYIPALNAYLAFMAPVVLICGTTLEIPAVLRTLAVAEL